MGYSLKSFALTLTGLTKNNLDACLLDLMPDKKEESKLFQSLPQGADYYLSSPQILSAIYHDIQLHPTIPNDWFQTSLPNKNNQEKPQTEAKAYIFAPNISETISGILIRSIQCCKIITCLK